MKARGSAPQSLGEGATQLAPGAELDGDALVDVLAEERALDQERLRFVLSLGAALWLALGLAYFPIGLVIEPRPLWHFLVPHLVGWASLLAAWQHVRSSAPGRMSLGLALALGFLVPALTGSVLSAFFRGIVSPFAHGTLVIVAAYAMAVPMPWRRGLPWGLSLALSWPLGLLALSALDPQLAAQLDAPRLRADFQETAIAQLVGVVLATAGQHAQWASRREVLALQTRHRYRLQEKLGEGGMGEVFRAHHPGLGRDVALKILRQTGDEQLAARFVREVRATAELRHPGIVRIYDCGATDEGQLFYTMELLEGRTLAQLVATRGPLPAARATYLLREAARALSEAHTRGLVHRDIKPENLFVATLGAEPDVLKVLDFGIAKSLASDASLTVDGALVGTPRYMALEQALGEKVDARADVYALGGVLRFALTGAAPVAEPTIFAVVAAHAAGLITPPSEIVPSVPPALDAIVMRCLHRDPDERFASAGELAKALDETGLAELHRPHLDPGERGPDGVSREASSTGPVDREAATVVQRG